jgi:hypothetical protein
MEAIIQGSIAAVKLKAPAQGQNYPPHNLISLSQVYDGEAVVIKVKDDDLNNAHPEGKKVAMIIRVNEWSAGNRSGVSKKFVKYVDGSSK